jgi:hypothetical protein
VLPWALLGRPVRGLHVGEKIKFRHWRGGTGRCYALGQRGEICQVIHNAGDLREDQLPRQMGQPGPSPVQLTKDNLLWR